MSLKCNHFTHIIYFQVQRVPQLLNYKINSQHVECGTKQCFRKLKCRKPMLTKVILSKNTQFIKFIFLNKFDIELKGTSTWYDTM